LAEKKAERAPGEASDPVFGNETLFFAGTHSNWERLSWQGGANRLGKHHLQFRGVARMPSRILRGQTRRDGEKNRKKSKVAARDRWGGSAD